MQVPCHSTHVAAGLLGDVAPEVAVGGEEDLLVRRQLAHDVLGVADVTMMSETAFTPAEQLM